MRTRTIIVDPCGGVVEEEEVWPSISIISLLSLVLVTTNALMFKRALAHQAP
jgi:hypothetical protein